MPDDSSRLDALEVRVAAIEAALAEQQRIPMTNMPNSKSQMRNIANPDTDEEFPTTPEVVDKVASSLGMSDGDRARLAKALP